MKTIFKLTAIAASALLLSGCVIEDAHYPNTASGYSSSYRDNMLSGYNRDYNTHRRHHAPSGYSSSKAPVNSGYASSKPVAKSGGYSSSVKKPEEKKVDGYASSGYSGGSASGGYSTSA